MTKHSATITTIKKIKPCALMQGSNYTGVRKARSQFSVMKELRH